MNNLSLTGFHPISIGDVKFRHLQPTQPVDWKTLREDFPILDQKVHGQPLLYLDNAATSRNRAPSSTR